MANPCCNCQATPVPDSCRQVITSADLAELLYIQGLDENLCKKFQEVADIVGFVDCLGNPIVAGSQIVTCAQFPARLCLAIAALADGPTAVPGVTELVGADCLTHVLPTFCAQLAALPDGPPITLEVTQVLTENCQLATVPETPITINDTLTVDLTVGGPFNHTLTADVNISEIVGNCLVVQADGLYVPCPDAPVDFNVIGVNSDCIDVTVTESPAGTFNVEAEIVISPNVDNALSCVGNGLFVNEVQISAGDGDCVDVQVTDNGNGDWTIVADAVISPDFGNALECRENGLYATVVSLNVEDTDCISLALVGDTLTATPIIDPDPDNALSCGPAGLFVEDVELTAIDSPTVDITIINNTIEADVIISEVAGNCLVENGDGLYVPCADITSVSDTPCINMSLVAGVISAVPTLAPNYPGFPVAPGAGGCNSLVCTADGLAAPPVDVTRYDDTIVVVPNTDLDPAESVQVVNITALVINDTECRQLVVLWDFTTPIFGIPTFTAGDILTVEIGGTFTTPSGVVGPSINSIGTLIKTTSGQDASMCGPLMFAPGQSVINPGEFVQFNLTVQITNSGPNPMTVSLGSAGVRLYAHSI